MNTYLKHFVRKFSTVALHAQNSLSGYKYDDIDLTKNYRLRSLIYEIFENRIDEGFHMAYMYSMYNLVNFWRPYMKKTSNSYRMQQMPNFKDPQRNVKFNYTISTMEQRMWSIQILRIFFLINQTDSGREGRLQSARQTIFV